MLSVPAACPTVPVACQAHQYLRLPAKRMACDAQVMGPRLGYLPMVAMQARAFFQVRRCHVYP